MPKVKDMNGKYSITSDYDKFTNNMFDAKMKKVVNESEISDFAVS